MKIKNHKNNNDYALSKSGHWVRNFTKPIVKGIDINNLISLPDMNCMLENEMKNQEQIRNRIDFEEFNHPKIVIISDGHQFEESSVLLQDLPPEVIVIGVNGAFSKWSSNRRMNYYVVNNPYEECMSYFPPSLRAWPKCIASTRTYPEFIQSYQGLVYMYAPIQDEIYSGATTEIDAFVDDYRNPICAAITLAYKFRVKKLLLLSLSEAYEHSRPGAEKVNNIWVYPQQIMAHALADTNLYWLQNAKIDTAYSCSSLDYEHATYIKTDLIKRFFNDRA